MSMGPGLKKKGGVKIWGFQSIFHLKGYQDLPLWWIWEDYIEMGIVVQTLSFIKSTKYDNGSPPDMVYYLMKDNDIIRCLKPFLILL